MSKTKELAFHRPPHRNYLSPSDINGMKIYSFVMFLGVWLHEVFNKHLGS